MNKYYLQNKDGDTKSLWLNSDYEAFEYAQYQNRNNSENWKAYDSRGNLIYFVIRPKAM